MNFLISDAWAEAPAAAGAPAQGSPFVTLIMLGVLFAAAGDVHRFVEFSDDFATWVLFYGPVKPA